MNDRVFAFCVGLGIGLGIGILFAPKSGQETRSLIRDRAVDGAELSLKRRGAEILQETGEGLKATVDAGKQAYRAAITSEPTA
jgi:hypothetical protein